jgi:hypothetical protein
MFIVMCRVSGGVTGTRESVLKNNGVVKYFDTREAAQAEASRLMTERQGDPYRVADFRYWVEEGYWADGDLVGV